MAIQFSLGVRDAKANALETTVSTSAKLRIYTGTQPANCGTASSGTMLCEMSLQSDWLTNASSNGQVTKNGTWSGTGVNGPGTAGYFRIFDSAGTTCHMQGSITGTGGGGDMELDNTTINTGQTVTVSTFSLTEAGA